MILHTVFNNYSKKLYYDISGEKNCEDPFN